MRTAVYPGSLARPSGPPPEGWEEVALPPALAWHVPCPRGDGPVLLLFHGNGEILDPDWIRGFSSLDVPVLAVEYPGYGRSAGKPSERGLMAAGIAALDWAAERYPGRALVPCGWSLGSAVAVQVAASRSERVSGLILMSPFTRLPDAARAHYPGWLVAFLLRERYDSLEAASRVRCPSLVLHGTEDPVVPCGQGRRIAAALPSASWVEIPGAGHNDLLGCCWIEIQGFVKNIRASSRRE